MGIAVGLGLIMGSTIAHFSARPQGTIGPEKIAAVRHALTINLDTKLVTLKEDGRDVAQLPLLALPKAGSPWEVAPGTYTIGTREESHLSPISGTRYPYAIQVNGNAFLHGPPEVPTTIAAVGALKLRSQKKVAQPEDATSLELSPKDAERLFRFVTTGDFAEVVGGRSGLVEVGKAIIDAGNFVAKALSDGTGPTVKAHAYLVGDLATGDVLLERNADESLPIASVTKLITGRVVQEKLDQNAVAKVSARAQATYGSQGELRIGESLTVKQLLYPLFLESSNDAAEVLAELYGRDKFVAAMNDEARELGMKASSFVDPAGLDPKSKSSARDLFTLARELYKSDGALLDLTHTREAVAPGHLWRNVNKLVVAGDKRYLGGKTGYIPEAGLTSVSLFSFPTGEFAKKDLVVILLRSVNRDKDINTLLKIFAPEADLTWDSAPGEEGPQTHASSTASMLFVGDIMMSRTVASEVKADGKGDYGFLFNFAPLLKTVDIAFGNLEGPLSDKGYDLQNLYSFRMEPASLTALVDAGFDALSIANNHIGDWGRAAFEDTLLRLRTANIAVAGAGETQAIAEEPTIVEKNGIKIGFLGFSDVGPEWLAGPAEQPVVLMASNPDIKTIIQNARAKVDHLVVSFHFGEEYKTDPTARQTDFAHRAINAGADIVIGTHPHVVEPVERYNGGVIAYSLGNFIFDQSFSTSTMQGLALEIHVSKEEITSVKQHAVKINDKFQPTIE